MAVTTQEIQMLGCDADACEIKAPAVDGRLPAKFETGTIDLRRVDDGEAYRWVACRETHVGKAAIAVKKRALDEQAPAPETAETQPEGVEPVRKDDDDADGELRRRTEEADLEALEA
jgi:hypothetical protein